MDHKATDGRATYYAIVSARSSGGTVYDEVTTRDETYPGRFYDGIEQPLFKEPEIVALWNIGRDPTKTLKRYVIAHGYFRKLRSGIMETDDLPERITITQRAGEDYPTAASQEPLSRTQEQSARPPLPTRACPSSLSV